MKLWIVLGFSLIVLLSNRWMGWQEGIDHMCGQDVAEYVLMAEAAPGLYAKPLRFHVAQRFAPSYLAGSLSRASGISIPHAFQLLTALSFIALIFCFHLVLEAIGLNILAYTLAMAFLIFNPYVFRFYLLVPGALQAVIFLCAMALILLGLLKRNILLLLVGCVIGTFCRQTTLAMLPGILWWVLSAKPWREFSRQKRVFWSVVIALTIYAVYQWTAYLAALTALPPESAEHLSGIFKWIEQHGFQWKIIGELVIRSFMPNIFLLAFMGGILLRKPSFRRRDSIEFFSCLLMMFFVSLQPILAGPELTGYPKGSGTRLGATAIVAVVTALAILMKQYDMEAVFQSRKVFWSMTIILLILNSFHHLYSWVLPFSMEEFIFLNGMFAFILGIMCYKATSSRDIHA